MTDILLDVVSHLDSGETQNTFAVATLDTNTVAGLIRKLCKENKIPMKASYVLRDDRNRLLQWSQTLRNCNVTSGAVLHLYSEEDEVGVRKPCGWNTWWFVAAMCLMIGGVGITAVSILLSHNGEIVYQYGIVMDAGSSHTKLFVYKWDGDRPQDTALVHQVRSCSAPGGGLTSFLPGNNMSGLADSLRHCLDTAEKVIPDSKHAHTPVFLGATAGMRMLNEVNQSQSDLILKTVRSTIKQFKFQFTNEKRQARIISGEEEGTFGWVTANYASERFGVIPPKSLLSSSQVSVAGEGTAGALDMGGASTQITFYTPKFSALPEGYKMSLDLFDKNYTVYTHSYLCYGINEAIRRYKALLVKNGGSDPKNISNPCGPAGSTVKDNYTEVFEAPCVKSPQFASHFTHVAEGVFESNDAYEFLGTGNEAQCQTFVEQLYNFTASCPYDSCTFNGTYQPPLYGQFYAFSSFFYEADFLNLTDGHAYSLDEYKDRLQSLCGKSWDEVKKMPTGEKNMLPWYCFEGHFILTLLLQGYKFNNDTWNSIQFVSKIKDKDVGWSLGFMLNSSSLITAEPHVTYISIALFAGLTALFVIFILLAVAFACHAKRQQRGQGMFRKLSSYGAV